MVGKGMSLREKEDMSLKPLVVDLDGTLIKSDMLLECALRFLKKNPLRFYLMFFWLFQGKAILKQKLVKASDVDVTSLPYNAEVISWIKEEKSKGRKIVLATASNMVIADAVQAHLKLFDYVFGSDQKRNLSGKNKRDILVQEYGETGFDYAGNHSDDIPIWEKSDKIIFVNVPKSLRNSLKSQKMTPSKEFPPKSAAQTFRVWLKAIRVHQWVKNTLIFVPLLISQGFWDRGITFQIIVAVISFSLCASSVYVLNDLLDIDDDRKHPTKCKRPFASGSLSLLHGIIAVPVLLLIAFALAIGVNTGFVGVLIVYYIMTTLYSFKLKRIALVDVFTLSALYTFRIFAGAVAAQVNISVWLFTFSIFIFLSLAMIKRYTEIEKLLEENSENHIISGRD